MAEKKEKASASKKFLFKQSIHVMGKDYLKGVHVVPAKAQEHHYFQKCLASGLVIDPEAAKAADKGHEVQPTPAQQKILDEVKGQAEGQTESDDEDFTSEEDEAVDEFEEDVVDEEESEDEEAPQKKAKKKKKSKR